MQHTPILLLTAVIAICSLACGDDDLRSASLPNLSVVENANGEAIIVDAVGRPVSGDITLVAPVIVDQGDYQVLLDGDPIGAEGCIDISGELTISPVEDGPSLRCACVDANGVKWTQDCPWFPFLMELNCNECCASHGGSHPPPPLNLSVNRPGKNTCGD